MKRRELPERRYNEHTTIRFRGVTYHICFGLHRDGTIGEIFASSSKLGTDLVNTANDACIMISYLLQVGADAEDFRELCGMFQQDLSGEYSSIVGVLAALVVDVMPDKQDSSLLETFIPERNNTPQASDEQKLAATTSKIQALASGYTGDTCVSCHNMTMRRNGTCLVCDTCGSTTGCS